MLTILIITQDDPFYLPLFFQEFIANCSDKEVRVRGVVIQQPLGKRSAKDLVIQMFDFYGAIDFARIGCRYTLFKLMNLVAVDIFKGKFPGSFSVEHLVRKHGLRIIHCNDVNSSKFLNLVRESGVDLILSVAASQKFKKDLMRIPRYGCINIHTSKLPKNRGMLPNFWSLYQYDEDPISAITIHQMNEKLDDGPIVVQEEFRLDPNESLHELIIRTKLLGAKVALRAIKLYERGEPSYRSNDGSRATYNKFPGRDDVINFKAKGLKLL